MQLSQVEKGAIHSLSLLPLVRWLSLAAAVITTAAVFDDPALADSSFELASLSLLALATVSIWTKRIPLPALWLLLAGANLSTFAASIDSGKIGGAIIAGLCFGYMVWLTYCDRDYPSEHRAREILDDSCGGAR